MISYISFPLAAEKHDRIRVFSDKKAHTGPLSRLSDHRIFLYMKSTSDETAVITGGGSGLGYEFAKILSQKGYRLILSGRNGQKLMEAAESCLNLGAPSVECVRADLSQREGIEKLVQECKSICSATDSDLSILINNAGSGLFGPLAQQDSQRLVQMLRLNIEAPSILIQELIPMLSQSKQGRILQIGSVAGGQPMPFFAAYGATKSYIHNFSLALRAELKRKNISVSLLEPGFIRTNFDEAAGIESKTYRSFSFRNGMSPERVAKAGIRLLFSGKARSMPGLGNRISAATAKILPDSLIASIMRLSVLKLSGGKD